MSKNSIGWFSRRKERANFERVVLSHVDALYRSAFRMTRNTEEAEDLVQDCLLRAYRFWDSFQKGSNCKGWLFKILTNTFYDRYNKKKRSQEILQAAATEQKSTDGVLVHTQALNQRSPVDLLIENSMSEEIDIALAALPIDFKTVVVLCDIENFSYKEIAEILECPVGTVMSRLHRGRRLLHTELHAFAESKGLLQQPTTSKHRSNTIDLAYYKANKNNKGAS